MGQHTPGPWKVAEEAYIEDSTESVRVFALTEAALAPCNVYGDTRDQMWANARLIAAAPEMLEALQRIAKGEGAFSRDPLEHAENVIEEHKEIARALLAKIEGEVRG